MIEEKKKKERNLIKERKKRKKGAFQLHLMNLNVCILKYSRHYGTLTYILKLDGIYYTAVLRDERLTNEEIN